MKTVIFSGPIRSGKTTAISKHLINRKDVGGFLSPDYQGTRHFYLIRSKAYLKMEASADHDLSSEEIIAVGKFQFLKSSFDAVEKATRNQLDEPSIDWIVIDEIGKLECTDMGFHELLSFCLEGKKNIIILVRDSLLEHVIQKYNLQESIIIHHEDLAQQSFNLDHV